MSLGCRSRRGREIRFRSVAAAVASRVRNGRAPEPLALHLAALNLPNGYLMTVTEFPSGLQTAITVPCLNEAWNLYSAMFADIDELAAQRHLMTLAEFASVYHHPDVLKFYAHDDNTGRLIGMSVMTRHLEAWPLISPRYFARRWPHHFSEQAIWYVGFVGVQPRHIHGFHHLIAAMYPYVQATHGIAVMDFCSYNCATRRLPTITLKLLERLNPAARKEIADTQTFIAYQFDPIGNS